MVAGAFVPGGRIPAAAAGPPRDRRELGGNASSRSGWPASMTGCARAAGAVFPPEQIAEVKALACELPATHGLPLGRFSRTELHRLVVERGVSDASASTIW